MSTGMKLLRAEYERDPKLRKYFQGIATEAVNKAIGAAMKPGSRGYGLRALMSANSKKAARK